MRTRAGILYTVTEAHLECRLVMKYKEGSRKKNRRDAHFEFRPTCGIDSHSIRALDCDLTKLHATTDTNLVARLISTYRVNDANL